MNKQLFIIFICISNLFALKIEVVEKEEDNSEKSSYIKDGRLVLNSQDSIVLKPMDNNLVKSIKNKILEPYNPILEKGKVIEKSKQDKLTAIKKEKVKKQFAREIDLKPVAKVKKEDIKVDKESTEFFNTLNSTNSKSVDIE